MQPGDLVKILYRNHWGGIKSTGEQGILLKMSYAAYMPGLCRWSVLVEGAVKTVKADNLKVIS